MLVGDLAAQWLGFKQAEVGASTLYTSQRLLDKRILPRLGERPVESITAEELQSMLSHTTLQRQISVA